MIDVLGSEYVAMARLKGMPPRIVIVRHALRNALLPAIQGSALVLGWLLGSVVVVENVFQYPGLGSALTTPSSNRDLPVIQAVVFMFAVGIVLFNIIADALTIYLTPKLRTGRRRDDRDRRAVRRRRRAGAPISLLVADQPARLAALRTHAGGLVITAFIVLLAVFGPLVAPHSPTDLVGAPFAAPSSAYPLGTDYVGEDVLSRVLWGGRFVLWMATRPG